MALDIDKTITELTECYKLALTTGNKNEAIRVMNKIEKLIKYATGV